MYHKLLGCMCVYVYICVYIGIYQYINVILVRMDVYMDVSVCFDKSGLS